MMVSTTLVEAALKQVVSKFFYIDISNDALERPNMIALQDTGSDFTAVVRELTIAINEELRKRE